MTPSFTVRAPHKLAMGLFALVWISIVWFDSWAFNPNNSTRLFAAISLVERHEATIDPFAVLTIDKAEFGRHYYLDKAPGMTLMATPAVAVADLVTGDKAADFPMKIDNDDFADFMQLRLRLAVATTTAILTAFAAVLLLDLATGITGSPQAGLVTALGYAMATPVWGWSTTLFGHAPVGALLLIATWAIWRGTSGTREMGRYRYPLMAGAALGWSMVVEFPAVISATPVIIWGVWRTREMAWPLRARIFGLTALAGAAALLPMMAYDEIAFGQAFKVGYSGVVGFNGMNQGLFGVTYPKLEVLWEITFGPARGMLWVAPILILAPFGLFRLIRAPETRDIGVLAAAITLVVLLYNASYVYWDGGYSTGPRHSIPLVGFLMLGIAPLWRRWRATGHGWIAGLIGSGIFLNLVIASTEIAAPSGYRFPIVNPILKQFFNGELLDLPGEYWDWPPLLGLMPWAIIALPLLGWIIHQANLPVETPRQLARPAQRA